MCENKIPRIYRKLNYCNKTILTKQFKKTNKTTSDQEAIALYLRVLPLEKQQRREL